MRNREETARHPVFTNPPKGRGFGPFIEGDPIIRPDQVKVGDLLTDYSIQFYACNLIRVTQTEWPEEPESLKSQKFYGIIVDPKDPSKPGAGTSGDMCFWNWTFNPRQENGRPSRTFTNVLHRAVQPHPVERLCLQANDFKTAIEASNTPEGRQMLEWIASEIGDVRFALDGPKPARIITVENRNPSFCPLLVEHFIR